MGKEATIWLVIAVYVVFMLLVGILNSKAAKAWQPLPLADATPGRGFRRCHTARHIFLRLCSSAIPAVPAGILGFGRCWWA